MGPEAWVPMGYEGNTGGMVEGKVKSDGWSTDYYQLPEGAKEIQDLIEAKNMNFAIGNIFKACYRLGAKEGIDYLYDLRKIAWYVDRELKRMANATK